MPHPCALDWETLEGDKEKRLCRLCGKTITDFSKLSNEELIGWFQQNAGSQPACGLFSESQIRFRATGTIPRLFSKAAFFIAAFFSWNASSAGTEISKPFSGITGNLVLFRGTVVTDSSGKPHPNARILIKSGNDTLYQASSLKNGSFSGSVPAEALGNTVEVIMESNDGRLKIHEFLPKNELYYFLNRAIELPAGVSTKADSKPSVKKPATTEPPKVKATKYKNRRNHWRPFRRRMTYRRLGGANF